MRFAQLGRRVRQAAANEGKKPFARPVRVATSSNSRNLRCSARNAAKLTASSLDYHEVRARLAELGDDVFVLGDGARPGHIRYPGQSWG